MSGATWARLFDTPHGLLLATIERDDEQDDFGVRFSYRTEGGTGIAITPGGWPNRDKAQEVIDGLNDEKAAEYADMLRKIATGVGA